MTEHHTKTKGDLAVIRTMYDLTLKGYDMFTTICEHLPFDLIAHKDGKLYKIQVKYSSDGSIPKKTSWANKDGSHVKAYQEGDFDYYAIYIPDKDVVCYPHLKFGGNKLSLTIPNSSAKIYWYEDFLEFTDEAERKTAKDFGKKIVCRSRGENKVEPPSKEELEILIEQMSISRLSAKLGMSTNTLKKYIETFNLKTKPRSFWIKKS